MKVRVSFEGGSRAYTYEWPDWQGPLEVGDVVEVPTNWAFPDPGRTGTVIAIGSDYTGPMAQLVRRVPQNRGLGV